jgi:GH15 family glucan-1,4-alpha-glucosidase
MAWLALERGVRAARNGQIQGPYRDWKQRLNQLHRQICKRGFNRKLQSFVQSFGSDKLDASTLLIPIFGFLPFEDERMHSTIVAIEKGLMKNGLVYRYRPESNHEKESAFLACSFWLVQNLAGVGRKIEAENLFDRLLRLRNDLGLLPEEYDPVQRRFMGNFPQALSHISLINAGWMMSANSRIRPTQ